MIHNELPTGGTMNKYLLLLTLLSGPVLTLADGLDSPLECTLADITSYDAGPQYDAPTGLVVDCVCIKTGGDLFDGMTSKHSGKLCADGSYGAVGEGPGGQPPQSPCFEIVGLGTGRVIVAEQGCRSGGLSHMDLTLEADEPPPPPPPGDDDDDDDDDDGGCGVGCVPDDPPITCVGDECLPHQIATLNPAGHFILSLLLVGIGIGALAYRERK